MTIDRCLPALCAALVASVVATPAAAEFPDKPVTLIAPFNAGGGTDLLLRGLQDPFAEALGGDVVVRNMAGGGGTVAASQLAGMDPDGYNLGYLSITVSTIQAADQERALRARLVDAGVLGRRLADDVLRPARLGVRVDGRRQGRDRREPGAAHLRLVRPGRDHDT